MLIKLAQKTLDETASWALYLCEVKFRVEYYTQPLPGGATLWMRLDEIAKEKSESGMPTMPSSCRMTAFLLTAGKTGSAYLTIWYDGLV